MYKIGDKVRNNIENKVGIVRGIYKVDKKVYVTVGLTYKLWDFENIKMEENMKIIYKEPKTEQKKREEFFKLVTSPNLYTVDEYLNELMKISQDKQEIEGVQFELNADKVHIDTFPNLAWVTLSKEQIKTAYEACFRVKE